jgi:hypothetical protein
MPKKVNQKYFFKDFPDFKPNLSPKYIIHNGFGGGYFRKIKSPKTGKTYKNRWKLLPKSWFAGLDPETEIESQKYDKDFNKYKVKCGASYEYWISKGWINEKIDPCGWFEWYCHTFQGRRTKDDTRQINRWLKLAGPRGRFRSNLCGQIWARAKKNYSTALKLVDDYSISPVIRQTLLHWGYELTKKDFKEYCKYKKYI